MVTEYRRTLRHAALHTRWFVAGGSQWDRGSRQHRVVTSAEAGTVVSIWHRAIMNRRRWCRDTLRIRHVCTTFSALGS
eukprot:COSAG06_NODE_48605_length_331_cov_0.452586_2_plen_77_part_01